MKNIMKLVQGIQFAKFFVKKLLSLSKKETNHFIFYNKNKFNNKFKNKFFFFRNVSKSKLTSEIRWKQGRSNGKLSRNLLRMSSLAFFSLEKLFTAFIEEGNTPFYFLS